MLAFQPVRWLTLRVSQKVHPFRPQISGSWIQLKTRASKSTHRNASIKTVNSLHSFYYFMFYHILNWFWDHQHTHLHRHVDHLNNLYLINPLYSNIAYMKQNTLIICMLWSDGWNRILKGCTSTVLQASDLYNNFLTYVLTYITKSIWEREVKEIVDRRRIWLKIGHGVQQLTISQPLTKTFGLTGELTSDDLNQLTIGQGLHAPTPTHWLETMSQHATINGLREQK